MNILRDAHETLGLLNQALFTVCATHPHLCDCHACKAWDGVIRALNSLEDHRARGCLCHQIAAVTAIVQRDGGLKQ